MYFEYEADNIVQPLIINDEPVENPGIQTVMEKGVGSQNLLIIETTLDDKFCAGMTSGETRVVSTNGFVTVLPSSTETAEDTTTNLLLLTIVLEELTDSPTKVSCRYVFNQVCFTPCALYVLTFGNMTFLSSESDHKPNIESDEATVQRSNKRSNNIFTNNNLSFQIPH